MTDTISQRDRYSRARLARDHRFDGLFFTAVITTRIYCRPICSARQPKEKNVSYYPSAVAAERAGYRPCLRCRPESAPGTPAWCGTEATVGRALSLIRQGALNRQGVEALAARLGISGRYLRRLFNRHLGGSPLAIAQTQRLHFAKKLLHETSLPITQIVWASGFGSISRFNHSFKQAYGMAPRILKRNRTSLETSHSTWTGCRLKLSYRPPYDWEAVLDFFRAREIRAVERVGPNSYARVFRLKQCRGFFEITHAPHERAFILTIRLDRIETLMTVVARVRRLLDLDTDTETICTTLAASPLLAPLVDRFPGTRLPGAWEPFEFAVRAVLGQQISVKAATTLAGRIVARYGSATAADLGDGFTHFFPDAEELAGADFQGLGLTQKRAKTLKTMTEAIARGKIQLAIGQRLEDFIEAFTQLPGIGPWTAHYIAMRGLGEPDAFPDSDLGLIKALGPGGQKSITPAQIRRLAESWRPWRAYATIYLWRSLATAKHRDV